MYFKKAPYKKAPYLSDLVGKTVVKIYTNHTQLNRGDEIFFSCSDGTWYSMYHSQDCCESVDIEEIIGDLNDLIGSPILVAESRSEEPSEQPEYEHSTWTFYEIATNKGSVTIRWYGVSNGYYSEEANFVEIVPVTADIAQKDKWECFNAQLETFTCFDGTKS